MPDAFGVLAIVLSINAFFEAFSEIGIKKAIIQNPRGAEQLFLNGAWYLSVGRAMILYVLAYFTAIFVSRFYENDDLIPLMRVAFLSIVINGAMSSKADVAMKRLNFKRWAFIFNGGGALGILFTIILSLVYRNVWALVIGFVSESLFRTLLSFIICPFKPKLEFDKELFLSLLRYARGIFGIPILFFIFTRIDVFVIGKLMPMEELGLYSMAVALAGVPTQLIGSVVDRVMMPAFSEIQNEKERINSTLITSTTIISGFGFPLLVFIALYGTEVLTVIYGAQYAAVSIPFLLIFASEFLRVSSSPIATVYLASGKPELHRLFTLVRTIVVLALIYPLVYYLGLNGAALSLLTATVVSYIFQVIRIKKLYDLNVGAYIKNFLLPLPVALSGFILWIPIHSIMASFLLRIAMGAIGCVASYFIIFIIIRRVSSFRLFTV
jgi:O-antigen/teichoic acid export membrane protein